MSTFSILSSLINKNIIRNVSTNLFRTSIFSPIINNQAHISTTNICTTKMRNHFPQPSEIRRIKRHGFKARMSTPEGRRVLMRRILKGRFVYSH